MTTPTVSYVIPAKMSNTGSIHDIACAGEDREIRFAAGCKFAVVLASYYGGKGYTTHKTEASALKASSKWRDYSHEIIGVDGAVYVRQHGYSKDKLVRVSSL